MPVFRIKDEGGLKAGMTLEDILVIQNLSTGEIFRCSALEVIKEDYIESGKFLVKFKGREITEIGWYN
jgi:hypothetical protein